MYNYAYDAGNTNYQQSLIEGLGLGIGVILGLLLVILAFGIIVIIANWKVFKKMGIDGWKSLIPFVNQYLTLDKIGLSQKWLLLFTVGSAIMIIPILGMLVFFIFAIYFEVIYAISLAKAFGKSTGFAIGLIFLEPIFLMILAFDNSNYIGANPTNDILFGNENKSTPSN